MMLGDVENKTMLNAHVTFEELQACRENNRTAVWGIGKYLPKEKYNLYARRGIHRGVGAHLVEEFSKGFVEELRLAWRMNKVLSGRDVRGGILENSKCEEGRALGRVFREQ